MNRRALGRYFTAQNPFAGKAFRRWAAVAGLPHRRVLEPFAGRNDLITMLKDAGQCRRFAAFDIAPAADRVKKRDTLTNFPKGFDACVTNPPWLARNSATRRGLPFPKTRYDDLYKHGLEKCLDNCRYVAAILPATFLQSGLFRARLCDYILLHGKMFADTDNPVCLALFGEKESGKIRLWHDDEYIGEWGEMQRHLPPKRARAGVVFNDRRGALGLVAFDNTRRRSIRFCAAAEIARHPVKVSSRFFARIGGDFGDIPRAVERLNAQLQIFRDNTRDCFLTPFKGVRADGQYRRRISFALARRFVAAV